MKFFRFQLGVAPKRTPILMAGNQCLILDREPNLEETAGTFVSQIVKVQIRDLQLIAGSGERGAH
jgi:hypothetical protein